MMIKEFFQRVADRQKVKAIQTKIEMRNLARQLQLQEKQSAGVYLSPAEDDELRRLKRIEEGQMRLWYDDVKDLKDLRDFSRGGMGNASLIADHVDRSGSDWPFFRNENDLREMRSDSRLVVGDNDNAKGLLGGLRAYTIGYGPVTTVEMRDTDDEDSGPVDRVTDAIRGLETSFRWQLRCREAFNRSRRDGNCFLRIFPKGSDDSFEFPTIRFVWPEQIRQPPGVEEEWSYGIKTDPDDAETVIAYAVFPLDGSEEHEEVPAEEMVHFKINVDSGVKMGIPDFCLSTADRLQLHNELVENMGQGSANQAAIAYVRQHNNQPASTVKVFAKNQADGKSDSPATGKFRFFKKIRPGTIIDTNQNTTFLNSPYNAGVAGHLNVSQMMIRNVCVRWNAPEWLGSSDASNNNYASSLTAESPFVIRIIEEQGYYSAMFEELFSKALIFCIGWNGLTEDDLRRTKICVTLPNPVVRNPLEKAQADQLNVSIGAKSPQLIAEENGDDWDRIENDLLALGEKGLDFGAGGLPLPVTKREVPPDDKQPTTEPEPKSAGDPPPTSSSNALLQTVGGAQSITQIQTQFYAGQIPREAAIQTLIVVFGLSQQQAGSLLPEVKPKDLTGQDKGPTPTPGV